MSRGDASCRRGSAGILRPRGRQMHSSVVTTARTPDDASLDGLRLRFLQTGDEDAMADLVRRTRPRLLGAARRIGHPQDAEDSVQAAYHALLRRGAGDIDGPVIAWLLTAVVRIAYRRKAATLRQGEIARRLAPRNPEPDPASVLGAAEEGRTLLQLLDRLPAIYRDTLVLHHLQGLPVADVALLLDAPESTIKARLRRGRALLRSRLPVSLRLALLAIPWKDPLSSLGGAMKAKTVVAAALALCLSAGGAVILLTETPSMAPFGSTERSRSPEREVAVPKGAPAPRSIPPAPSPGREPAPTETSALPLPSEEEPLPKPGHRPWEQDIPARVLQAAKAAGVPAEALQAAWNAYVAGGKAGGHVPAELLEELRRHGADGFRAVLCLLRGDLNGTWFPDLAGACWSPGLEKGLVDVADDPKVHVWARWSALESLARADTPMSRDYLVDRLPRETNEGLFMAAANALATLHEPRAAEACAARIREKGWGERVRGALMWDLVAMDAGAARRLFLEYVREPGADLVVVALKCLARVDAEAAKAEAVEILDRSPAGSLPATQEWDLRELAGRPHEPDRSR